MSSAPLVPVSVDATEGLPLSHYAAVPHYPSRATMLRAIRCEPGRPPLVATRVGGEYRVTPADFDAWLALRRVPANTSSSPLTPDMREWAEQVAAEAPALAPAQAAEVARILAGGATA